jgi:hypothetical protein
MSLCIDQPARSFGSLITLGIRRKTNCDANSVLKIILGNFSLTNSRTYDKNRMFIGIPENQAIPVEHNLIIGAGYHDLPGYHDLTWHLRKDPVPD